ncbi:hypothetical protein HU200_018465 [Digitaria exilis]|uniref:glutathione transferase n=1 Tax=Digitaria exilis TaxID=1010633 RepID=A0A835F4B2_9POAL|nr:hypothetical protein HU200_018465 [Digitaria exilis]CAB3500348.1 unnamed protein product [Digitaria exilis]
MASNGEVQEAAVRVIGGWACPYAIRVFAALKLKAVDYEFLQEPAGRKSELLLRTNPVYKKIPVLLHRGAPICESMIIIQYIDQVWASNGPAILPAQPYARAMERFWAQYVDDKIAPALLVLRGLTDGDKDNAAAQVSNALQHLEEAFVKCSQGKHYFGGDNIGFLDLVLGSHLGWFKAVEKIAGIKILDEAKYPEITAWADRFCAHHAVKDVMPETERLVEFSVNSAVKTKPSN